MALVVRADDSLGTDRVLGVALVATAAVMWSTAGPLVRLANLDTWSVIGWRSMFSAVFLFGYVFVKRGRAVPALLRQTRLPDVVLALTSVGATICYIFSLQFTTVANVMTVYATVPFVAAGIAFLWLGERPKLRLLLASALALVGIVVMVGSATSPRDIAGNVAAFAMTASFALQLVLVKRHPPTDMPLVMAVAAAIGAVVSWPLMPPTLPSPMQFGVLAALGVLTTGLGYIMVLEGGRRIGSGEAGFISMVDVVLGPLWMWLAFAEAPGHSVLVGGALVLLSVTWYLGGEIGRPAHRLG